MSDRPTQQWRDMNTSVGCTVGLDARAAAIVMRAVRNVARNGRTVMVTIHQPSIEIFESFDQLLLIQVGLSLMTGVGAWAWGAGHDYTLITAGDQHQLLL